MSGISAASFDVLVIADSQTVSGDGVTSVEMYVFAYLACLLALYDGREASWWGYSFVGTKVGAPYSRVLAEAAELLTADGLLERSDRAVSITPTGREELGTLAGFSGNVLRKRYLTAACSCALTLPLASLGETIKSEPQLKSAIGLIQSRVLLDEAGMALLEPHFSALRKTLGAQEGSGVDTDLMIPGVIWLTYLASKAD